MLQNVPGNMLPQHRSVLKNTSHYKITLVVNTTGLQYRPHRASPFDIYNILEAFTKMLKKKKEERKTQQISHFIHMFLLIILTGLLNGPMFRRYTFRQVAMVGSVLIFFGILLTAFCETFLEYIASYALLFGKSLVLFFI